MRRPMSQSGVDEAYIGRRHGARRRPGPGSGRPARNGSSEICKSIEGVTVAEYERRVNEIVLLAFQLRERRRKARTAAAQLKILQ